MLITHDMGVIAETCDRVAVLCTPARGRDRPGARCDQPALAPPTPPASWPPSPTWGRPRAPEPDRWRHAAPERHSPGLRLHNRAAPARVDRCMTDRPDLMSAGNTRAACWLHAADNAKVAAHEQRREFPHASPWCRRTTWPRLSTYLPPGSTACWRASPHAAARRGRCELRIEKGRRWPWWANPAVARAPWPACWWACTTPRAVA